MKVIVTEAFGIEVRLQDPAVSGDGAGGEFAAAVYSPAKAREVAAELVRAAAEAESEMEDHIAESRRRGWVSTRCAACGNARDNHLLAGHPFTDVL